MASTAVGRLTYEHVNCAVIVAHPDDETLWAGGTLLLHPDSCWTVVALTHKGDADRASRFHRALESYTAKGILGDLDDGPEQKPLRTIDVEDAIMALLPSHRYDLILTHSLWGSTPATVGTRRWPERSWPCETASASPPATSGCSPTKTTAADICPAPL